MNLNHLAKSQITILLEIPNLSRSDLKSSRDLNPNLDWDLPRICPSLIICNEPDSRFCRYVGLCP